MDGGCIMGIYGFCPRIICELNSWVFNVFFYYLWWNDNWKMVRYYLMLLTYDISLTSILCEYFIVYICFHINIILNILCSLFINLSENIFYIGCRKKYLFCQHCCWILSRNQKYNIDCIANINLIDLSVIKIRHD